MDGTNKEIFEKMVMTGFEPLKAMLEYGKLEDRLTEKDIDMVARMIGRHLKVYREFLIHAKAQSRE